MYIVHVQNVLYKYYIHVNVHVHVPSVACGVLSAHCANFRDIIISIHLMHMYCM